MLNHCSTCSDQTQTATGSSIKAMTQRSARDLCLTFLSQRRCRDEKKWIPFRHREGAERNRNPLRLLRAPSPALGSLRERGQPLRSQHSRSYCLPLPNGTCLWPPGEKTVASATTAVLGCQRYSGRTIPRGKQR